MSEKISKIIQKISRMRSQYSDKDILAAIRQILTHGFPDKGGTVNSNRDTKRTSASNKTKPFSEGVSRAILDIEESDPEKFDILSHFDRLLRKREVLKDMRSLREFGQSLDKSFEPGKSRKAAVPKLVQVLADIPVDRLAPIIESVLEKERRQGDMDDDYRRLANFLITKKNE